MPGQGRILLIANPAAKSGAGAEATAEAGRLLREALGTERFEIIRTMQPRQAVDIAREATDYETVLVLGGDGIIHEAVNGLMQIPHGKRPALGVIPVGSGNDYARSLHMSFTPATACAQLLEARPRPVDIGCANGEYFTETLSFGVDAAIALDTIERRKKSGASGTLLYAQSGIDQMLHHLESRPYTAHYDEEESEGSSITFAVQVGPTYGGGFLICPDAQLDDGLFDICIAHPPAGPAKALYIFARAKNGSHIGFKQIEMRRAHHAVIRFETEPPAQIDGEPIHATTFDISMETRALNVLIPE